MKTLTLGISSMLLLIMQGNAQQQPEINVNPTVAINTSTSKPKINVSVNANPDVSVIVNVQDEGDDPLKTKKFTKTFALDKNGSMTIKTWDKNEIKVDADIKAYANTDAEAQKLLDDVSIIASKTGDLASFKTTIENHSKNGWNWGRGSNNGKKWRREVKVHLVVYMPASNSLTASQAYGNINMGDFSGPTLLKVQYGNLVAGDLNNSNNYIAVEYGKAVARNIDQAKIKLQYGGGLTINSIGGLDLNAEYTNVNIAELKGNATNKIQYGKLTITEISNGCKSLSIDADYTSVNLGFNANYNADFSVATNYGGFKYGGSVKAKKEDDGGRDWSSSKKYAGQIGKGGTAKISISTEYGSVNFK